MSICTTGCAIAVPKNEAGCGSKPRKGGVPRLVALKCDVSFADVTDLAEWQTKITADEVHASPRILGQKPKGSATKKKFNSETPEQVTGYTKSLTFQDYNADENNNTDYDFWNGIDVNSDKFLLGYFTSDELFFGFIPDWALEIDDVAEEDSNGTLYFDGAVTWNARQMLKPVHIPGIFSVLE